MRLGLHLLALSKLRIVPALFAKFVEFVSPEQIAIGRSCQWKRRFCRVALRAPLYVQHHCPLLVARCGSAPCFVYTGRKGGSLGGRGAWPDSQRSYFDEPDWDVPGVPRSRSSTKSELCEVECGHGKRARAVRGFRARVLPHRQNMRTQGPKRCDMESLGADFVERVSKQPCERKVLDSKTPTTREKSQTCHIFRGEL